MRFWRKYIRQLEIYSYYWKVYGGKKAVFESIYFHAATIITFLCFSIWTKPEWWNITLSVVPNMMGFSLGGFAIIVSFGGIEFQRLIATKAKNREFTAYQELSAAFTHFIIIQVIAIVLAIICKAFFINVPDFIPHHPLVVIILTLSKYILWFTGFLFFIYAVTTALAASMRILRLTRMFIVTQKR